jgi:CRP/FNR family transcriptional regulator
MQDEAQLSIEKFFSKYPLRKYPKKQILIHFDEPASDVIYIVKGKVKLYNIADNGTEIVLNIYRNCSYFPVNLALSRHNSDYIYEAMTDIEIRKAPVKDFNKFFLNSIQVMKSHLLDEYKRTDKALKRTTYTVASSAYNRIIFEIINECGYLKHKEDGSYRINMHEYEIAESAGLTRETANRQFNKLKKKNLVTVTRKFITLHDLNKLKIELGEHI